MSAPKLHRWRHLIRVIKAGLATVVIATALVVGGTSLAMPWIQSHPEEVRAFLSQRLQREVRFETLTSQWRTEGPLFSLSKVEIDDPAHPGAPFKIVHAQLAVDFYAWLKRGVSVVEFRIDGVDLDVVREVDGSWRVARLGQDEGQTGNATAVLDLAAVALNSARVHLEDAASGRKISLDRVDVKVLNSGGKRRFGALLHLADDTAPIEFACESAADSGRCYLHGEKLEPARWMVSVAPFGIAAVGGTLSAEAWFDWSPESMSLRVESSAQDLILRGTTPVEFADGDQIEPRAAIEQCRVAFSGKRSADGRWVGDFMEWRNADTRTTPSVAVHAEGGGADGKWQVSAPMLSIDAVAPIAALSDAVPAGARLWLFESAPHGSVVNLIADHGGRDLVNATLNGFGFRPGQKTPGLDRLSGELEGDSDALIFTPTSGQRLVFDFPRVFRQPIEARWQSGKLSVLPGDDGWRIEGVGLDLLGTAFALQGRASLWFDQDRAKPALDTTLDLQATDIGQAKLFWPVNVMPKKTVDWLDRALVRGRMTEAHALIHGDLDDWPFDHQEGRFDAWARIVDTELNYNPNWPRAQIDSADLEFIDNSMIAEIASGSVLKNRVVGARAEIAHFGAANLQLHVDGEGPGNELLDVLRQSPLREKLGKYLAEVSLAGPASVALDLDLPLHEGEVESVVHGTGQFDHVDLIAERYGLRFAGATGGLRFSNHGFATDALAVSYRTEPASLHLASGEFVEDAGNDFEAKLEGVFAPATLFGDVLPASATAALVGRSAWRASMVSRNDASGNSTQQLSLNSDLVGTAIALPAPLGKTTGTALPTALRFELPLVASRGSLTLGDVLKADLKLPAAGETLRAAIGFGATAPPAMPVSGMLIRGNVALLDLAGFAAMKGEGGVPLDAELAVAQLDVVGRSFHDLRVKLTTPGHETRIEVEGAEASGRIALAGGNGVAHSVTAEFSRLHLPPGEDKAVLAVDPAGLPTVHFKADDLRLGATHLGATRMESWPTEHGMHVDSFSAKAPEFSLDAKGDWTLVAGREKSAFEIAISSENLGKMLDALGYVGIVDGGQTLAEIKGEWDGAPGQFALAVIDGTLKGKVGEGRVLEVDPGAGRLFGLFSLQALPRRLSLDFSDFFRSGLSFDSIDATFELKHGDAFTSDLKLKGPAADVAVTGRAGLKQHDYDQEIVVTPHVRSVLPVVGALAGGPVGAAAGFVIQRVLPHSTGRARYKVTGPWEKPNVILIAKEKDGGEVEARPAKR